MAQTNVNIRMDSRLKSQFETFCDNVGLTMSTAFNVFAKATVQQQKIPFEIAAEPDDGFYSEANMRVLSESIRAAEEGRLTPHELIEVD